MSWDQLPPNEIETSAGWDAKPPVAGEISQPGGPSSAAVVAARNLAQGATANFSDELAGGVEAIGRAAGFNGLGVGDIRDISRADGGATRDWEVIKEAYRRARDQERADLKKDAKERPGLSANMQLVGAVASPVNKVTQGMSLAKAGAVYGGLGGVGESESDNIAGTLADGGKSALTGVVAGKALEKVAPLASKIGTSIANKTKDVAEKFAARAIGAERGTIKSMGKDAVQKAGRYALDNKILSGNTEKMISKNESTMKAAGELMDDVYSKIDSKGLSTFRPLKAAGEVDEKIGNFYRSPINKGETNQLENTIESILMRAGGQDKAIPIREAQALKEELGKVANWKNNLNISDKEKMARDAYRIVSGQIDEAVNVGAEKIGSAGLLQNLKKGRELYSSGKSAEKLLENKFAREQGNKFGSLTDYALGAGSLGYAGATGDVETAAGLLATKKVLEKYGAKVAAKSFDSVSKFFAKSPALSKSPAVVSTILTHLKEKSPVRAASQNRQGEDGQKGIAQIKGETKWALDGLEKIAGASPETIDEKTVNSLLSSRKGKALLIKASELKSGSKKMSDVVAEIKNLTVEVEK